MEQSIRCNRIAKWHLYISFRRRGLIGYWNFNDGSDATIEDLTGNGNNGALSNLGTGDWGLDAFDNNPLCLGTGECVDSVSIPTILS